MRKVNFEGSKGRECVDLVDVGQLRARCQGGRMEGATVQSLLELQRHGQRAKRSLVASNSAPLVGLGASTKSMVR
jgi:hypothetical protein